MKKANMLIIAVLLVISASCLCGCFGGDKNKDNMVQKDYDVVSIKIEDRRYGTTSKEVLITDSEKIKSIVDSFKNINGKKMKMTYEGYPTLGYVYQFESPCFLMTLKVSLGENSYFTYKIYCGQKTPIYEYGTVRIISYDYNYRYVGKDDPQTGHYENTTDGKDADFFLAFWGN